MLFRFPSAVRHDPAIDAWLDSRPAELAAIGKLWYARLRGCGSDIRELMHDGNAVACVEDVAFAYVGVFTAHVNVGFFNGALLDDPAELLVGSGKRMRHVKLRPDVDPDYPALENLIDDACQDARSRIHQP